MHFLATTPSLRINSLLDLIHSELEDNDGIKVSIGTLGHIVYVCGRWSVEKAFIATKRAGDERPKVHQNTLNFGNS